MTAQLLQGQPVAEQIRAELAEELFNFKREYGVTPQLAIVQVGDNSAATAYVRRIEKAFAAAEMV
ncbi:MAG TPA: tetrahydrofolate dehydrogenase/cyclohydrolase catalytic domain-containing protein, partial [Chloroflexota bacterium]|nr:tetrahydrofolate dehydrogenase/cyclohydrolase catalytic domain-containing protein [Chloroflexota bacterium]